MSLLLDAAEYYAVDLGWPVLPLRVGEKVPAIRDWVKEATTNRDMIRRWWRAAPFGIGISCERVVVLDVDTKNGALGRESLAALEADCGALPPTWRARTASGGLHFYFAPAPGQTVRRSQGVRPGLDLCGRGGQVVCPPTQIESGSYTWLEHDEFAVCPAWVASLSRDEERRASSAPSFGRWGTDEDLTQRIKRALSYIEKMPPAIQGSNGSGALWKVALVCARGFALPHAVALEVLRVYNARCVPPWSTRELEHKLEDAARASSVPPSFLLEEQAA